MIGAAARVEHAVTKCDSRTGWPRGYGSYRDLFEDAHDKV